MKLPAGTQTASKTDETAMVWNLVTDILCAGGLPNRQPTSGDVPPAFPVCHAPHPR